MAFIENGVKFACEPCIRGHRSSKCQHADRNLVEVRKPGRPLSSCPHTGSCSCPPGVRVAIPKASKCSCGDKPSTNGVTKPYTPSSAGHGVSQTKGRSRLGSKSHGTVEEFLASASDMINSPAKESPSSPIKSSETPGCCGKVNTPSDTARRSTEIPNGDQSDQTREPRVSTPSRNEPRAGKWKSDPSTPRKLVRKGTESSENGADEKSAASPSTVEIAPRSCCAPKQSTDQRTEQQNVSRSQADAVPVFSSHNLDINLHRTPIDCVPSYQLNGFSTTQTSLFTNVSLPSQQAYYFPADLSTWNNPLTLESVSHIQSQSLTQPAHSFAQNKPQIDTLSAHAPLIDPISKQPLHHHAPHGCTCGDTCACLMCPAHPFNKATAAALQAMSREMSLASPDSPTSTRATIPSLTGISPASLDKGLHSTMEAQSIGNLDQRLDTSSLVTVTPASTTVAGTPATTWSQDPMMPSLSPVDAPADQAFASDAYYHLWYPASWIESHAKSSPP